MDELFGPVSFVYYTVVCTLSVSAQVQVQRQSLNCIAKGRMLLAVSAQTDPSHCLVFRSGWHDMAGSKNCDRAALHSLKRDAEFEVMSHCNAVRLWHRGSVESERDPGVPAAVRGGCGSVLARCTRFLPLQKALRWGHGCEVIAPLTSTVLARFTLSQI